MAKLTATSVRPVVLACEILQKENVRRPPNSQSHACAQRIIRLSVPMAKLTATSVRPVVLACEILQKESVQRCLRPHDCSLVLCQGCEACAFVCGISGSACCPTCTVLKVWAIPRGWTVTAVFARFPNLFVFR